jgi:hypothetical protein
LRFTPQTNSLRYPLELKKRYENLDKTRGYGSVGFGLIISLTGVSRLSILPAS